MMNIPMQDRTYHRVTAIILSAAVLGVALYGTYFPMRKAQMFIATLQTLQTTPATSISDLETRVSVPLDYPSPIGQEELVRNLANSVLGFIQQGADPTSTAELISFLNTYYMPILDRGRGMSFGQDVYLEGAINEVAFAETGQPAYINAAKQWYSEAHQLGPNRPQALYGLFDVYRAENDGPNTIATANEILTNWPSDTRIQQAMAQFMAQQTSTASKTAK